MRKLNAALRKVKEGVWYFISESYLIRGEYSRSNKSNIRETNKYNRQFSTGNFRNGYEITIS